MKHILMLFTDQQRWDTIGALGNPAMQTPHLDALARESTVFEQCYTPSPVCVPARLSMFAGQYPARTGCNNNNAHTVYQGEGFYSRITKADYQSCAVGKMHHLVDPYGPMGFERRVTQEELSDPRDDYTRFILENHPQVFDYHGMRSEMYYVPQISPLSPEDHPTQWIGDKSVEYIRQCGGEKPMFLVSSFIHPPPPYCPPAPWQKLYREDPPPPLVPSAGDMENLQELVSSRCGCERLMISFQDLLRTKNFYYACVSFVDYQVGRIIQALKDQGMYDDTLVLFSSDHGDMMGDYNALGKRTMMDSSCHIPLLIRRPGHPHEVRRDPCSLVDVAPTLLRYAGAAYREEEFDGLDLFGERRHDAVFSQLGCGSDGVYMVTDGKNKLVYHSVSGRHFLFKGFPDVKNVYAENEPAVKHLKPLLDAYRAEDTRHTGDSKSYEPYTKSHPHYPGRYDHAMRHDEEAAAIPKEYHIDLD